MAPMPRATSRPRKTVEDYLALPDDVRAELIAGELYVTPSPSPRHQSVVLSVAILLDDHVRSHDLGRVFVGPLDVHLPSGDIVQPDALFIAKAHTGIIQEHVHGVPDLAVEVLSPSRIERDRFVKRDRYALNGIPEYWLIDLAEQTVEVLRHEDGAYQPAGYFQDDQTLRSRVLPELHLRLAEILDT